jgi:hypothetical protein
VRIVGEVKIDIPRPRTKYLRAAKYFQQVDEVVAILENGKRLKT